MSPQNQMVVGAAFSFFVGAAATAYGLWPAKIEATPQAATAEDLTACKSYSATGPYQYGGDYFTKTALDGWQKHLKPLAGKKLHYLEVGIFEGRSMLWMLDNVLSHPESTATGIDIIIYSRYMENLVRSGKCAKVRNLKGRSQDLLHTLPKGAFDVIYIDGSHLGQDVLVDAALAFDLLKVGGLLVFDDYRWYPDWASDIRPGVAIDSFVTLYRHQIEFVHRDYQLMVRKKEHPCEFNKYRFTPVGNYCYQWVDQTLVKRDQTPVELLPGESALIAEICRSAPFGEVAYPIDQFKGRTEFQALNKRLRLFDL